MNRPQRSATVRNNGQGGARLFFSSWANLGGLAGLLEAIAGTGTVGAMEAKPSLVSGVWFPFLVCLVLTLVLFVSPFVWAISLNRELPELLWFQWFGLLVSPVGAVAFAGRIKAVTSGGVEYLAALTAFALLPMLVAGALTYVGLILWAVSKLG